MTKKIKWTWTKEDRGNYYSADGRFRISGSTGCGYYVFLDGKKIGDFNLLGAAKGHAERFRIPANTTTNTEGE